jgi:hypothetical protein
VVKSAALGVQQSLGLLVGTSGKFVTTPMQCAKVPHLSLSLSVMRFPNNPLVSAILDMMHFPPSSFFKLEMMAK